MKFIKITNQAGNVNRLHLEKLGLSTKRDDVSTIGQFGTGIKFAPIAAIRKGLRWVFTGTDAKGDYILEYIVKDDEGIPCVFYKYQDYEKPSSFTADAGLLSWEEPFQIIREVIANAIDQATMTETDWSMVIVDESDIKNTDGEFSVFITLDDSLVDIVSNFDKYFSVNRKAIYDKPGSYTGFKIFEPIDEFLRIYSKGVLVYCTNREKYDPGAPGQNALYDYEFPNLDLNEERTIKSIYDVNWQITNALCSIEDERIVTQMLSSILDGSSNDSYEFNAISDYNHTNIVNAVTQPIWKKAFEALRPGHVLVDKVNSSINSIATIKGKGFNPIVIDNDKRYMFLKSKGIPTATNTLGESFKYDYDTDISKYPKLIKAVNIVTDVFEDANFAYPNYLATYQDNDDMINGMTLNYHKDIEHRMVLINTVYIENAEIEELVGTLIHELDHFIFGIEDGNMAGREFRKLADVRLANLAMKMYLAKPIGEEYSGEL